MSYLLIKSLHVCAIILWIAGMVLQSLALQLRRAHLPADLGDTSSATELRSLQLLQRWDRHATAPAMLLAWITGLFLATQGGWFGNRWLFLKLAIVVMLSATHGVLAGRLRAQMESRSTRSPPSLKLLLPSLFVMTAGIVLLVIVKPF